MNRSFVRKLQQIVCAFQINRPDKSSTAPFEVSSPIEIATVEESKGGSPSTLLWTLTEVALIVICFGVFAGQIPPDVNESHYLTKARHFWNPSWCPEDIFLSSSFSHLLFYISTGWLTWFCSLSAYAWIGRIVTWILLAAAWQRLSFRLIPNWGYAFLSALFFLVLNDQFQMAGEWVVGGFEAKGLAYAFVLFALERMVAGNWSNAWILLGIATAFHVLVGGWATLAGLLSWIVCSWWGKSYNVQATEFKTNANSLLAGLGVALVGLLPPLIAEWQTSSELSLAASNIYVKTRISHHLLFGSFPTLHVARFAIIVITWIAIATFLRRFRRLKPLQIFCLGSLLISFAGLILSGIEEQPGGAGDLSRKLLRFYWFRFSDFAVPAALAISVSVVVSHWIGGSHGFAQKICGWLFVVLIMAATGLLIMEKNVERRPVADQRSLPSYEFDAVRTFETYENWRKVCSWIQENTPVDSRWITPLEQQTFKWYAGRTEIVSWKDIPQDAEAMVEWHQRVIEICQPQREFEAGLLAYSDEQLIELARKYQADYLIVPQQQVDLADPPTKLKRVYPEAANEKSTYVVFEF